MCDIGGEGFNLALSDSLDLVHVLAAAPAAADARDWQEPLKPRLVHFEEAMQARAQEKAQDTVNNMKMFLSENGAQKLLDFFMQFAAMATEVGPPEGE